jgi:hypothetical protein
MRTITGAAAAMLSLVLIASCNGGDDGPTGPPTACSTLNLTGQRAYTIRGGCEGSSISMQQGNGSATYDAANCRLVADVTPPAVRSAGGNWTLTGDLRNGTATVVRTNTTCPNTDTGPIRIDNTAIVAEMAAPASPCDCRLVYVVNISLPIS